MWEKVVASISSSAWQRGLTVTFCFGCVLKCVFYACVLCTGPQLDVETAPSNIFLLLWCSLVHSSKSSFLCRWRMQREGNAHMHACTHTCTHTQTHTANWYQPWFRLVHLVEKKKKENSSKLKCFRDVEEEPVFFRGWCRPRRLQWKHRERLHPHRCCQELRTGKNIFIIWDWELSLFRWLVHCFVIRCVLILVCLISLCLTEERGFSRLVVLLLSSQSTNFFFLFWPHLF